MSGIDLLFSSSVDYERTHQIALYTLFKESDFATYLLKIGKPSQVLWEPEGQLFDLAVVNKDPIYIEIKMWSSLTDNQKSKQTQFLSNRKVNGVYILLGTSWFEYTEKAVSSFSSSQSIKVGYKEIIDSLNKVLISPKETPDIMELTLSYRNALQRQFDGLKDAYKEGKKDKIFYYSLFNKIREQFKGVNASIYTVNNPGGEVYILNDDDAWTKEKVNNIDVELYFEVVKSALCIKFHANNSDNNVKRDIRDKIRKAIHSTLDNKYNVLDAGRLGSYMTACQIEHDFSDTTLISKSAALFEDIHSEIPNIVNAI